MIYLDTSAAVKALVPEEGTGAVRTVLTGVEPLVSSRLLALELHSAVRRRGIDDDGVDELLARIQLISLDDVIVDAAITARSGLRALDAVHLATALQLEDAVDSILCFDRELLDRAERAGIPPHPLVGSDSAR